MGARRIVWCSLIGALAGVLVGGCGGSASPSPTSIPTVTPTVIPTEAASPTSVTYGGATVVTGIEKCDLKEGTTETAADGTLHARGWTLTCDDSSTDPRVSGAATYVWNYDFWGSPRSFAHVQWGTGRIVNSDGAWDGTYTGSFTAETGDLILFWFKGTGAYAGLSYGMWAITPLSEAGLTYPVHGIVFPGSPPAP